MPAPHLLPGMHRYNQMERVHWGVPVARALAQELEILQARRVFVVTNRSMADTAEVAGIVSALGDRFVGSFSGVTAHSPRACVIEGAVAAGNQKPDLLLAIGGGSVIDATKAMLMCLRHGYTRPEQMDSSANVRVPDLGHRPDDADLWVRMVAVPTTLSGAEFAPSAGLTDPERGLKHAFSHPMQTPVAVILDPAMTLPTPLWLLKATGMKAVDHAAERMTSAAANPFSDAVSSLSLRMLSSALRELEALPRDIELRSRLQYGMFMSLAGSAAGVAVNVSHAIGHVLGAHTGIAHGDTTGIVLPAVLQWMHSATEAAQREIARALGREDSDAASAVRDLALGLGVPTRLRDVGVLETDISVLAAKTMHEALLRNSKKPVTGPQDIETILRAAW